MRPRRREIARSPDRKIARLVDDPRICPRLASTAMTALQRRKPHATVRPQPRNGQPGHRRPPRGPRRARLRRRIDRRRPRHRPLPRPSHPGLAARPVLRRASRPGAGGRDAARPERDLLRAVRPGRLGADPAGAGQPAARRAGGDRHHHGRADHAGQRRRLRGARRHRRPARHQPGGPAGLAHHGLGGLAGRRRQHLPVPADGSAGRPGRRSRPALAGLDRPAARRSDAPAGPVRLPGLDGLPGLDRGRRDHLARRAPVSPASDPPHYRPCERGPS